jgi:hypothetical protein
MLLFQVSLDLSQSLTVAGGPGSVLVFAIIHAAAVAVAIASGPGNIVSLLQEHLDLSQCLAVAGGPGPVTACCCCR